jgi:hypothetical protein
MTIPYRNLPGLAFFRFHLSVGIRLALRTLAPVASIIFAFYYFFRIEFFATLVKAFFIESSGLISGLLFSVFSLSIAGIAASRICLGLTGWIRHLPVSSQTSRRLAALAIFIAQIPVLVFLVFPILILSKSSGIVLTIYIIGLPFLGLASAVCVLPVQRKLFTRPLAAVACVFSASGNWSFLMAGFILIACCDLLSGSLIPVRKRPRFHRTFKGSLLYANISWRALRLRVFPSYILPLLILGGTSLFISNNDFSSPLSAKATLFGGTLGLSILLATLANILASRRPPWPWARSLPWSARQRIVIDSLFLAAHTLPLLVVLALMNIGIVSPLLAILPSLILLASFAMRRASEYRIGVFGMVLVYGVLGAFLVALIPLISLLFLALSPVALKYAVDEERCQKVSRWLELHHLAAGDSLTWSQ